MNIRDHPFLWQWDRNRALAINEPGALYVDFDRPGETPDRRKVVDGIAEISDTWLQKAGPKNIYICIQGGTLIGYTLLVLPRPKPVDYVDINDAKYEALKADMLQRIADTDADLQAHKKAWAEEVERETAVLEAMGEDARQKAKATQTGIEALEASIDATYEGLDILKSRVPDVTLTKAEEAADSSEIGNRLLALERLIGRIRLPPVNTILRSLATALVRAEKSILAKASVSGRSKGTALSVTVPSQAAGAAGGGSGQGRNRGVLKTREDRANAYQTRRNGAYRAGGNHRVYRTVELYFHPAGKARRKDQAACGPRSRPDRLLGNEVHRTGIYHP